MSWLLFTANIFYLTVFPAEETLLMYHHFMLLSPELLT